MFEDIKNRIDFFLRSKTRFSRKNFVEKSEEVLYRNYLENLYTLDILEKYFEKNATGFIRILDAGSKNWFYAKGEYAFFKSFADKFSLDGIELDAFRLYSNFYSRYEAAKFYTKGLNNTRYLAGNLLKLNTKYDYIIWFLPFVVEEPHKMWGLPKKYFYPEKLLKHAFELLKTGGQMLIVNQGEEEAIVQKNMLEKLNIKYEEKGIVKSEFLQYKNNRYAFLIRK